MKTITVNNIKIGEGRPKIIVPLVGGTESSLLEEVIFLQSMDFDVLEWRVDYFAKIADIELIKSIASKIKQLLPRTPIMFTFRSLEEGGNSFLSLDAYIQLNIEMISSGLIDFIDVELFLGENHVKKIIMVAHDHNVAVVISNHDFEKTPPKNELIDRLIKMQQLGADILKIAVMPKTHNDVLTLLAATLEMKEKFAKRPMITMSMGTLGVISRIAGETFGSAMTFGSGRHASAPGQIAVHELRAILETIAVN